MLSSKMSSVDSEKLYLQIAQCDAAFEEEHACFLMWLCDAPGVYSVKLCRKLGVPVYEKGCSNARLSGPFCPASAQRDPNAKLMDVQSLRC